jgi:molybdopterin synthase catalytic subunit
VIRVGLSHEPQDLQAILSGFASEEDGALLIFLGVVRNHNDGRAVTGLDYEAYAEMGEEVLEEIAGEARASSGSDRILIHHRVGSLGIGEVSTVIAVATPHRGEAYEASRYIIEEIKKRLPVWKKENYVEGDAEWVKGHIPEVDGSREGDQGRDPGEGIT